MTYINSDMWFALQKAGKNLLLNLGQFVLQQCFLSTFHAVLAVGQHQRQQIPLILVTDHVQLCQVSWAYRVTGGNRTENDMEKQRL